MRTRLAVLVVVAFAALGVLAGTASAYDGSGGSGVTCTHSASYGTGSFTCTSADGSTLSCTATWSWRPFGFTLTCTLPDGSTKTFAWPPR